MAVTLEIWVCDLLTELLAHTLVFLSALEPTRTITTGSLQAFLYSLDYFCIFIESNCHGISPFSFYYILPVNTQAFSG